MAKFVVYEKVAEAVYRVYPKKDMSDGMQTVVSQPADTMLSKINKTKAAPGEGTTARLIKIGKELGFRGSFSGLGARLFMVGTLTAFQFAIYGYVFCAVSPFHGSIWLTIFSSDVKRLLGATGGIEIAK
jgi:solute carrier family 25 phosphate transporter 3